MFLKYGKIKTCFMAVFTIASISSFCIWQNNHIVTTQFDYTNSKIPDKFNGFKIVQISDLHNKEFGKSQKNLLRKIRENSPDVIVITGDLIDRRRYDLDTAIVFIKGAMEIAPIYYVSGNHEAWSNDYKNIRQRLLDWGVHVLDDEKTKLRKDQAEIELLGLSDPGFFTSNHREGIDRSKIKEHLRNLSNDSAFQILLCHRPELFDLYADANIDLIFCGHAHGGQFRIPFIGGLIAPGQGLFPRYTSGYHTKGRSTMFISRGLGNSIVPVRIFNRPEMVVVTLQSE